MYLQSRQVHTVNALGSCSPGLHRGGQSIPSTARTHCLDTLGCIPASIRRPFLRVRSVRIGLFSIQPEPATDFRHRQCDHRAPGDGRAKRESTACAVLLNRDAINPFTSKCSWIHDPFCSSLPILVVLNWLIY